MRCKRFVQLRCFIRADVSQWVTPNLCPSRPTSCRAPLPNSPSTPPLVQLGLAILAAPSRLVYVPVAPLPFILIFIQPNNNCYLVPAVGAAAALANEWTPWSPFSACLCGKGERQRTRICSSGRECDGPSKVFSISVLLYDCFLLLHVFQKLSTMTTLVFTLVAL